MNDVAGDLRAAKLTKVQRDVLMACHSWSADWEIRDRMGRVTLRGIPNVLTHLRKAGLVDFYRGNFTYRITDAGRRAISQSEGNT